LNNSLSFAALGLSEPLLRALDAAELTVPTPIQAQAIPHLLAGRDALGIAQTGTGKTAAFGLPLLQHLAALEGRPGPKGVRALILAPTRELAIQIGQSLDGFGRNLRLRRAVVFGGVGLEPQVRALAGGVDILVATPGRLADLLKRGALRLDGVRHLVLDEADRMLDMGFVKEVMRIVERLPKERQSLLFSATMPEAIRLLGDRILKNPIRVEVTPETVAVDRIEQHLFRVEAREKRALLVRLLADPAIRRGVIFTRTKRGADRVAEHLREAGIDCDALHGNKSQGARQKALARFKAGTTRILVATDIAARGIDVADITHVVNFEMPNEPESYVHRIGRTARAGRSGVAISFCDPSEHGQLKAIERLIRRPIAVHPASPQQPARRPQPAREAQRRAA
jgi:ATP-dependent RNA helicase RhlE